MTTILDEIQDFLKSEFTLDKTKLTNELRTISALRAQLIPFIATAHRTLLLRQEQLRRPTEKGLTDFDRRTMLQADTAEEQYNYELASSLSELLSDRRADSLSLYERL